MHCNPLRVFFIKNELALRNMRDIFTQKINLLRIHTSWSLRENLARGADLFQNFTPVWRHKLRPKCYVGMTFALLLAKKGTSWAMEL